MGRGLFKESLTICLVILGCALILFWPAFISGKSVTSIDILLTKPPLTEVAPPGLSAPHDFLLADAAEVFYPDGYFVRNSIRSFHLPLWSPYINSGFPLLASQQSAPFYPLNMIGYLLPWPQAYGLVFVLKLILAGLGTYLLARYLNLRRVACVLAGLAYPLSALFVSWLQSPHTNIYALLPWLILATEYLLRRRNFKGFIGVATVVACMVLGGHPESSFLALFAGATYALL